jgi:hypothetical protein
VPYDRDKIKDLHLFLLYNSCMNGKDECLCVNVVYISIHTVRRTVGEGVVLRFWAHVTMQKAYIVL